MFIEIFKDEDDNFLFRVFNLNIVLFNEIDFVFLIVYIGFNLFYLDFIECIWYNFICSFFLFIVMSGKVIVYDGDEVIGEFVLIIDGVEYVN